jgi:dTDP-4-dehydrorhamnose reductase
VKVLITGADGQLGTDLCRVLDKHDLVKLTIEDGDIADAGFVSKRLHAYRPDVVINTAAYVRVDDCEDNNDLAFRVNAQGAKNVAMAAEEIGARMVHIGSDYVFGGESGQRNTPYAESDKPVPCNAYGRSKLAGEEYVRSLCSRNIIVRSSGLFGTAGALGKGGNFVETMIRLAGEKPELRVVNDQFLSPTYTCDLAAKIAQLMETEFCGVVHVTNIGQCSWYEFAAEIIRQAGLKTPVVAIPSDQFPQKATRPRYSVLGNEQLRLLGQDNMRPWQDALRHYMADKGHMK